MYYKEELNGRTAVYVQYTCENGHDNDVYYHSITIGHRCQKCTSEESSRRLKRDTEDVRDELKELGLVLVSSEYTNANTAFKYLCTCGEEHTGTTGSIRKGIRGGCQLLRGENSPHWNPDLTEEDRQLARGYPEYDKWVQDVYARDNYTCQKCSEHGGMLNAHHILSYRDYKEKRVDLDNGITLCYSCHSQFHKTYGYKDFTHGNLAEFLETSNITNNK